jgi:hypothetical protein
MRKKLILITIFTIFFLIIPLNIYASYEAVIKGTQVRIRTGPSTNNEALYSLGENTPTIDVTILPIPNMEYPTILNNKDLINSIFISFIHDII